jgi:UDP-N-acetylmuramate--alanine ligase
VKTRIGIIFGGISREREISFAGGRTVYDNLNKEIFEPVPLFVDAFGNFILLDWQYIYKGSIRDFYPPVESLPVSPNEYQIYAESIGDLNPQQQENLISGLGRKVAIEELPSLVDFVFLCLHGTSGEDGRIQGLLEYHSIPYSGSGILSSAIGINKAVQKRFMKEAGFNSPDFTVIAREEWKSRDRKEIFRDIIARFGPSFVIKAANQGSSIGVGILHEPDFEMFSGAVNRSFFMRNVSSREWEGLGPQEKADYIRVLSDIREGVGVPVLIYPENDPASARIVYHPEELLRKMEDHFGSSGTALVLESLDAESEVLIEGFIEGKEFSCIVIMDEAGKPVALPPTEIRKGKELFDYRSKYLPGLSRKITPINLPAKHIRNIRKECERLFTALHFNVYARIDGFIQPDGKVFLNDPNTTSGMMPSSFFFHQAAEIGLNPSQFLTYIIRTSLAERIKDFKNYYSLKGRLSSLDRKIAALQSHTSEKIKIAVIFGGYSSERHISVESGRNIYEKLSSSAKYHPVPVFLTGDSNEHLLYQIPVNLLLKDNADDIKEKIQHYEVHPLIREIIEECQDITGKYSTSLSLEAPRRLTYEQLAGMVDGVFIALHGRPGEDGEVQARLEKLNVPYNGSGIQSSKVTINKFETNEILMKHGMKAASHAMVYKDDWKRDEKGFYEAVLSRFKFPFIAKPVDDGCSSAVKKINRIDQLKAFTEEIFRDSEELSPEPAKILNLKPKEEFPQKNAYLIEELITAGNASRFLEITGGMLTHYNGKGEVEYEFFEASEALSEGDVLSLEEKFLAGQGQNITPARYAPDKAENALISDKVKAELEKAARILNVQGYARIDAFVRIFPDNEVEVIFVEVNSLPGMTPATCIFHQCAINGYKPYEFIDRILEFGFRRKQKKTDKQAV